jgi:hypothetical protein
MASWGEQMFKGVPFIGQMGNETVSLFDLIGKGILSLTTGQNATGTPEEQQMVQGVLGEATKSTSQEEYDYYKNTGGAGSFSEFINQPKVPAETIPQAINVMRRPRSWWCNTNNYSNSKFTRPNVAIWCWKC